MMETDSTGKAMASFFESTGYGKVPKVPLFDSALQGAVHPMQHAGAREFVAQFNRENQPAAMPGAAEPFEPLKGAAELLPGQLPVPPGQQRREYLPNDELLGKLPYQRGLAHDGNRARYREAVGIGAETDRRSPGTVAQSIPNQGRFVELAGGTKSRMERLRKSVSEHLTGQIASRSYVAVLVPGILAALLAAQWMRTKSEAVGAAAVFTGLMTLVLGLNMKFGFFSAGKDAEKNAGAGKLPRFESNLSVGPRDLPLHRNAEAGDPNPFPKMPDRALTLKEQYAMQQLQHQESIEGPRDNFGYRRTAPPVKRLQAHEMIHDIERYNMDKPAFDEYMASIEGEAPNQFYQRSPYMPWAASWGHRQVIGDDAEHFGISTSPGTFNRKFPYTRPKIEQAGAPTMHLQDLPPGQQFQVDREHPFMQGMAGQTTPPFDSDEFGIIHSHKVGEDSARAIQEEREMLDMEMDMRHGRLRRDSPALRRQNHGPHEQEPPRGRRRRRPRKEFESDIADGGNPQEHSFSSFEEAFTHSNAATPEQVEMDERMSGERR